MRRFCLQLMIHAAIIATGAATAYRGADNRLSEYDDARREERRHPGIEYRYPDESSVNHIGVGEAPASRRHLSSGKTPRRKHVVATSTAEVFRTSQWGSARIPHHGAVVHVRPNRGRQRSYRGTVTTTILNPNSALMLKSGAEDIGRTPARDQPVSDLQPCYRCPPDKTVVAAKHADLVLLEKPALKPCHQRSWSPEVQFELVGTRAGAALREGSHVVHGRIVYRQQVLQNCHFRYTVIVSRCPALDPGAELIANCTASTAWGSHCRLGCTPGFHPLGATSTSCGDDLRWSHPLPRCIAVTGCTLPPSPERGRLSCATAAEQDFADLVPEGTKCRYVCGEEYEESADAEMVCGGGEWRGATEPTCRDTAQGRRHRHRKHRVGPGRRHDPCTPNPCGEGGQCVAGPHAALALCSCPPEMSRDDESCHNVVLVERGRGKKERRRNKLTTVVGHVYAKRGSITPVIYENGA